MRRLGEVGAGRRSVAALPGRTLVAAAITAAFVASCGRDGGQPPRDAGAATRFGAAMEALCEAGDQAAAGKTSAAEEAFFDSAHAPLHELAAEAGEVDREAAGSLLEAKFRVEEALRTTADAPELRRVLDELAGETAAAAEAIGETVRPCDE